MRERRNDLLRALIVLGFRLLATPLEWRDRWNRRHFRANQARLRRRFGIDASTPIHSFESGTADELEAAHRRLGAVDVASTSGSTGTPKRLLYPRRRLRMTSRVFLTAFIRVFAHLRLRRWSLFVLAPPGDDGSLTSLLLREPAAPPWPVWLQAPYRAQPHPEVRSAMTEFGPAATRAVLLALSNPGVLYATNPSTIALFFEELRRDWDAVRRLATETLSGSALGTVRHGLTSRGGADRLRAIATTPEPLPRDRLLPGLEAFICWDGGDVAPFLDRARRELGPDVRHVPMYSMSTETIETVPACLGRDDLAWLPTAPGVLVEFLPDDAPDHPELLVKPHDLKPNRAYTLVVSDAYGLRRHQTEDLFRGVRLVDGLPDLRFLRRRNLSHSFTGEKLTGEQVRLALEAARRAVPELGADAILSVFPSLAGGPHYVVACAGGGADAALGARLATEVDHRLCEINGEFRQKRTSRLGGTRFVATTLEELVTRAGGDASRRAWDGQFKFLPLYRRPWDAS